MSFLKRLFGKKKPENGHLGATKADKIDPANDPNMIKVFDGYGREMFITRLQWKDNVLLGNLEKKREEPDQLYSMLVGALQDGFAEDIVPYAEHLYRIDPVPSRGATILGIVYMENNRLNDAESILQEYLSGYGDDGVVLTNLAKVYSHRGDNKRAELTLWHALEVDPNQDNGLDWYAAIHRDRGGEKSALDAYRRVAALPQSWRAQLWLAREALQGKDLTAAKDLYKEAISRTKQPVPPDLLMQISGDLGNNGYLSEIIQFVEPHFEHTFHGLQVGNNLIKAFFELGKRDKARNILDQLYAQKRQDWQETLSYWDTELAKAEIAGKTETVPEQLSVTLMSVEGPLWCIDGSPFAALLPTKPERALQVAILGSTALLANPAEKPEVQLSDAPGRISRAIPLFLAEKIHLNTDAIGLALIPWAQNQGFALFGRPYEDKELCDLAGTSDNAPDFLIAVTVDTTNTKLSFLLRFVRRIDRQCLAKMQFEAVPEDPGPAVEILGQSTIQLLSEHANVSETSNPKWYQIPSGHDASYYLLRLEQQLAVTCMHLDFLEGGGLSGEHEILDGILHLCVSQPDSQTVRMNFAQTLRQMQKVRPGIISEYKEKIALLQKDHPLPGEVGELIETVIEEIIASAS